MAFTEDEIRANRDCFTNKLHAERARSDVLGAVQGEQPFDFTLLDMRGRQPFADGHISRAICTLLEELEQLAPTLPKDREIVTYCWGHDWQLSAKAALRFAERGFFAKELNVSWKEWTYNRHPTHKGKPADGFRCECSKTEAKAA